LYWKDNTTYTNWNIVTSINNLNNGYPYLLSGNWLIYKEFINPIKGVRRFWEADKLENKTISLTGDIITSDTQQKFYLPTFFSNIYNKIKFWFSNLFK
jgi:hypothetical protein